MVVVKMLIQNMKIYFFFTKFGLFFMLQNSYWFNTLHCMRDSVRIYTKKISKLFEMPKNCWINWHLSYCAWLFELTMSCIRCIYSEQGWFAAYIILDVCHAFKMFFLYDKPNFVIVPDLFCILFHIFIQNTLKTLKKYNFYVSSYSSG